MSDEKKTTKKTSITARFRSRSLWTRSGPFKRLVKWAFGVCDRNGSGEINKTELYAGLLLVHVNLAKYAGPAACFPPTPDVVDQLFDASDADNSGTIDETEFTRIMVILSSSITTRIASYYAILILLVPYLIQWFLDFLDLIGVDRALLKVDGAFDKYAPEFIQKVVGLVPDSTWETLPETLVSLGLFYLVIPVCWDYMDSFFRQVAVKSSEAAAREKEE